MSGTASIEQNTQLEAIIANMNINMIKVYMYNVCIYFSGYRNDVCFERFLFNAQIPLFCPSLLTLENDEL